MSFVFSNIRTKTKSTTLSLFLSDFFVVSEFAWFFCITYSHIISLKHTHAYNTRAALSEKQEKIRLMMFFFEREPKQKSGARLLISTVVWKIRQGPSRSIRWECWFLVLFPAIGSSNEFVRIRDSESKRIPASLETRIHSQFAVTRQCKVT